MKKLLTLMMLAMAGIMAANAANKYDNPDTLFVARDGTAEFRNIDDALEVCRAFMEYHKVIFVKKGVYKEKLIVPSWLTNIEICGEDVDNTIITYDDHANIYIPGTNRKMGTFRSYTVRVDGNDIKFKNITIENSAARLGQSVALHTQGDRLVFVNCKILGNQDTIYTGGINTRLFFKDCHIEGTTDFIFGPSTAWFENCTILSRINSYITAASTPENVKYGYVFNKCRIVAGEGVTQVYLGRPWRPYGYTLFMDCNLGKHIRPEGWFNWNNPANEKTARYYEYNNHGEGASLKNRVAWGHQLTKKEAAQITVANVFRQNDGWVPSL